ncbi:hypothetical protein L1987_80798 [Smallanthus sonchifolius]|uniref:Uncharacterized protein n=1 Tax=Smallanthus sonchifolius TaxID=185202 RepID=A0ACB8YNN0_9ASTR|nr:hypothetical protein L1987_80798 [Smallanthus sonchifolius]
MPRPGPRPYECVRRAWHSDRHQPMRGSLIQEIFRVVNEIHSPATRKNKEWQDKLPVVVLKAEEILYSKASSEAEYMDLETLWDRANDAINTIIRLDEDTETGAFLQPCIEAALNLGCTPVRTSRSQRNNTSTYYLNIKNTTPNLCPLNNSKKTTLDTPMTITPLVSHYSQITKPYSINLSLFNPKPQIPILPNDKSLRNKFCFPSPLITKTPPSVYPLYYGNVIHLKDPKISYGELKENGEMGFVQNPSFCNHVSENNAKQGNLRYASEEHSREHECDLSLRIGPSRQSQPFDHVGDSSNSRKCNFQSEDVDVEARMRKRKAAVVGNLNDNLQFCLQPNASSNGGSLTNAGL